MFNVLTIDVEEYYQVSNFEGIIGRDVWDAIPSRLESPLLKILDLLESAGASATFFVLGRVARRSPSLVKEIHSRGFEIANHGLDHKRVYDMSIKEFEIDLSTSEDILQGIIGEKVIGYRAPSFSIRRDTLDAIDILIDRGYIYDSSLFPVRHPEYGFIGIPYTPFIIDRGRGRKITEFPPATFDLLHFSIPVGGGGYFRILPYRLTYFLLSSLNRIKKRPFTFFIHPWELDPSQPRMNLPLFKRFRHYTGLDKTETKMKKLLNDFRWTSVKNMLAIIDFEELTL